ncbi:MAG: FtsP/CotA-like multicopper oxidase with cupredoxin domain, partial [Cocleimonas sp.]
MNNENRKGFDLKRRRFVQGLSSGGVLASLGLMSNNVLAAKQSTHEVAILDGPVFDLTIEEAMVNFTGKTRVATAINGSIPAPTLRMREGDDIVLRVTNKMAVT